MRQAICIIHARGDSVWLQDCLNSIDTKYPLLLTNHDGWCMAGIQKIWGTTDYDEIVFLNESMVVKDNAIWDIVFNEHAGESVMLGERFLMFFGKFRRSMVDKLKFPVVHTKLEDILLGEGIWCHDYMNLQDHVEIEPLADGEVFEEKYGRINMVLENSYFKKYKGTWDINMV